MEQRREPRFRTDQPVTLTVLGKSEFVIAGRVRNVSGRGLGLEVPQPIPAGTALKIEASDAIILAEAVFCRRDPDSYFVGVALEQVLSGLAELGKVLQRYADEPSAAEPVHAVKYRRQQDRQQAEE